MTNRWHDDNNTLAYLLTHAADYLADDEGRSDSDITVEVLREAADRLKTQDDLKRGRITTWHAQQLTAVQLRAYLEGAEWAESRWERDKGGGVDEFEVTKEMPGTKIVDGHHEFRPSSNRYYQRSFPVSSDSFGYDALYYHRQTIEAIAAIEDRGELDVWLDVRDMEGVIDDEP